MTTGCLLGCFPYANRVFNDSVMPKSETMADIHPSPPITNHTSMKSTHTLCYGHKRFVTSLVFNIPSTFTCISLFMWETVNLNDLQVNDGFLCCTKFINKTVLLYTHRQQFNPTEGDFSLGVI